MSTFDLKWMVGGSIGMVTLADPDYWSFQFSTGGVVSTQCHWRILEHGHIAISDDDHGQQFGLPEPIDAAEGATALLSPLVVTDVEVREGTLDLMISFNQGTQLQIIPFSSGYELADYRSIWDPSRCPGRRSVEFVEIMIEMRSAL